MNDPTNQADKMVQGYSAMLSAFIEANRKLAEALSTTNGYTADDVAALETVGKNAVIIRGLLWD